MHGDAVAGVDGVHERTVLSDRVDDLWLPTLTDCDQSVRKFLIHAHVAEGGVQVNQLGYEDVWDNGIKW